MTYVAAPKELITISPSTVRPMNPLSVEPVFIVNSFRPSSEARLNPGELKHLPCPQVDLHGPANTHALIEPAKYIQ